MWHTCGSSEKTIQAVIMFIEKAIQNLLNDRDIKRSSQAELRKACEAALSHLGTCTKELTNGDVAGKTKSATAAVTSPSSSSSAVPGFPTPSDRACYATTAMVHLQT